MFYLSENPLFIWVFAFLLISFTPFFNSRHSLLKLAYCIYHWLCRYSKLLLTVSVCFFQSIASHVKPINYAVLHTLYQQASFSLPAMLQSIPLCVCRFLYSILRNTNRPFFGKCLCRTLYLLDFAHLSDSFLISKKSPTQLYIIA